MRCHTLDLFTALDLDRQDDILSISKLCLRSGGVVFDMELPLAGTFLVRFGSRSSSVGFAFLGYCHCQIGNANTSGMYLT